MKSYTSTMLQILKIDRSPHNEDFHPYTTRNATTPQPPNPPPSEWRLTPVHYWRYLQSIVPLTMNIYIRTILEIHTIHSSTHNEDLHPYTTRTTYNPPPPPLTTKTYTRTILEIPTMYRPPPNKNLHPCNSRYNNNISPPSQSRPTSVHY